MVPSSLRLFNQLPFNGSSQGGGQGLGTSGLVYIPKSCEAEAGQSATCALHVSLHGCQNPFVLEEAQVHALSFNRWAETNKMVILWPKAIGESCWDSYGHEGELYDTKVGDQMQAIRRMIEAIAGVSML